MDKKAIATSTMIVLFLFVFIGIGLMLFAAELTKELKEDADIETCRLSVLAQAHTKLMGKSPVPLDCPRRFAKVYGGKIEINGRKSEKYDFEKLSQDEVNKMVAEELRLCWYRMGEGGIDVFENSFFIGTSNACLSCTEIEFDDNLKYQSFAGLLDYLKSKKIKKTDSTYFDYLIKTQNGQNIEGIMDPQYTPWGYGTTGKVDEGRFYTNKKYSIYFLALKSTSVDDFTGNIPHAYYIGLGTEDKLAEECNTLVN